jgi:hypothetical protein
VAEQAAKEASNEEIFSTLGPDKMDEKRGAHEQTKDMGKR